MRHLAPTSSRILWVCHVAVTSAWLGCLVAMITLAISTGLASTTPAQRATWGDVATVENLTAAMAVTTILIGLVQSLWGGWGFVRHRWILAKWLLALAVVASGIAGVHPGARSLSNGGGRPVLIAAVMVAQLLALLVALALSRFKPWRTAREAPR